METIYDRYGGFAAIHRVVMDFYERVLESDALGPYFDGVDMARLIDHQTQFVSGILGGPAHLADARLRAAHAAHSIPSAHFDEIVLVLSDTLADHGFSPEDVAAVAAAVEARRGLIVAA